MTTTQVSPFASNELPLPGYTMPFVKHMDRSKQLLDAANTEAAVQLIADIILECGGSSAKEIDNGRGLRLQFATFEQETAILCRYDPAGAPDQRQEMVIVRIPGWRRFVGGTPFDDCDAALAAVKGARAQINADIESMWGLSIWRNNVTLRAVLSEVRSRLAGTAEVLKDAHDLLEAAAEGRRWAMPPRGTGAIAVGFLVTIVPQNVGAA